MGEEPGEVVSGDLTANASPEGPKRVELAAV